MISGAGYFKICKLDENYKSIINSTEIVVGDKSKKVLSVIVLYLSAYNEYSYIAYLDKMQSMHYFLPNEFNSINVTKEESDEEKINEKEVYEEERNEEINEEKNNEEEINEDEFNEEKDCENGYYPFYYKNNYNCYNNDNKPENLYFDYSTNKYYLCYETCKTCNKHGDENLNNCESCINEHVFLKDSNKTSNCYKKCTNYYYFTVFDQYRCTKDGQCQSEVPFLIRKKNKCVDNCNQDEIYKYQYNSECFEKCPNDTKSNEKNICEDNNINKCKLSNFEFNINLNEINVDNIELFAQNYAKEFIYTNNHISQYFSNNEYSFILYKNNSCIDELNLNFSLIDFGECYKNIQKYYNIQNELITFIIRSNIKKNKPVYENILSNVNLSNSLLSIVLE